MAVINGYTTLQAVKYLLKISVADSADDGILEELIGESSRFVDTYTGRRFYPSVETHSFDCPSRGLWFDDDLLAVITLTNGDATVIASSDYILFPANVSPKYMLALTQMTSTTWELDSSGNSEQVIDVLGWWGFHSQFATRAWVSGSLVNEALNLNATDTTFTVDDTQKFRVGQVIKIDNEAMTISYLSGLDITVSQRGDNGSTAAIHLDNAPVYIWQVEPEIELATRLIATTLYHNRFGQQTSAVATVTPAGVILAPEDIPAGALKVLQKFVRLVP